MASPRIIQIHEDRIDTDGLREVCEILSRGGIAAFPTETVYGIGCLKSISSAVERIYTVKGREQRKPLAVYLPDISSLRGVVEEVSPQAEKLISSFLPGSVTLIMKNKEGIPTGYRVSPNTVLKSLLELLPEPIVGTSANKSGEKDPVDAEEVQRALGDSIDVIIDSGPCTNPVPSTVVDCTGAAPVILREGRISVREIQLVLK